MIEIGPVSRADQAKEIAKIRKSEAIGGYIDICEAYWLQEAGIGIEIATCAEDVKCLPDRD